MSEAIESEEEYSEESFEEPSPSRDPHLADSINRVDLGDGLEVSTEVDIEEALYHGRERGDAADGDSVLDMNLQEFMELRAATAAEERSHTSVNISDEIPPEMRGLDGMSPPPHQLKVFVFDEKEMEDSITSASATRVNASVSVINGGVANGGGKAKKVRSPRKKKTVRVSTPRPVSRRDEESDPDSDSELKGLVEQMDSVHGRLAALRAGSNVLAKERYSKDEAGGKGSALVLTATNSRRINRQDSTDAQISHLEREVKERDVLLNRLSKNNFVLAQDCDELRSEVTSLRAHIKAEREKPSRDSRSTREQALIDAVEELSQQNEELIIRLRASMEREIVLRRLIDKGPVKPPVKPPMKYPVKRSSAVARMQSQHQDIASPRVPEPRRSSSDQGSAPRGGGGGAGQRRGKESKENVLNLPPLVKKVQASRLN